MIAHILRNPAQRAAIERALAARGVHGDSMIAHINPQEAGLLKQAGGAGTINPKTGLLQFDPTGGSNAGGAGHAGDSGNNGGKGGGGSGSIGGGLGGYNGQGRGATMAPGGGLVGGDLANDGSTRPGESAFHAADAAYNGSFMAHAFGAKPSLTNSASYADGTWHTGGSLPGAIAGLASGAFMPGSGMVVGPAVGAIARAMGIGDTVLGGPGAPASEGMMKGMGIGGSAGNPYGGGGGWGSGGPNNAGGNVGQNGGGQHDGSMGSPGSPGSPNGPGGAPAPGGTPAPGQPPVGLPPAMNPALASLFYGGQTGADPFNGRFGPNAGLLRYLIAQGQPSGSQLLG